MKRVKYKKTPRVDDITVEELKVATIDSGAKALLRLFREIWEHEVIPTEWKYPAIIPIYKKKDKLDCSYYKGLVCCDLAARSPLSCKGSRAEQRKY